MICPKCLHVLEDFSWVEGGWCPIDEEWWPPDIIEEWLRENE